MLRIASYLQYLFFSIFLNFLSRRKDWSGVDWSLEVVNQSSNSRKPNGFVAFCELKSTFGWSKNGEIYRKSCVDKFCWWEMFLILPKQASKLYSNMMKLWFWKLYDLPRMFCFLIRIQLVSRQLLSSCREKEVQNTAFLVKTPRLGNTQNRVALWKLDLFRSQNLAHKKVSRKSGQFGQKYRSWSFQNNFNWSDPCTSGWGNGCTDWERCLQRTSEIALTREWSNLQKRYSDFLANRKELSDNIGWEVFFHKTVVPELSRISIHRQTTILCDYPTFCFLARRRRIF